MLVFCPPGGKGHVQCKMSKSFVLLCLRGCSKDGGGGVSMLMLQTQLAVWSHQLWHYLHHTLSLYCLAQAERGSVSAALNRTHVCLLLLRDIIARITNVHATYTYTHTDTRTYIHTHIHTYLDVLSKNLMLKQRYQTSEDMTSMRYQMPRGSQPLTQLSCTPVSGASNAVRCRAVNWR